MRAALRYWPAGLVLLLVLYAVLNPSVGLDRRLGIALSGQIPVLFTFAIMAIGLDIIAGDLGLLHLGAAGTVAIGAYTFAILTSVAFPFQVPFWPALAMAVLTASFAGSAMALPVLGLRGDYLAIVTLGFGEIVQIALRNLEAITQGSRGVNPVAKPVFFGYALTLRSTTAWALLMAGALAVVTVVTIALRRSRIGLAWSAIRDDELAANAMGIRPVKLKLLGFAVGSAWFGLAGALGASYLQSSGEPGTYSFNVSIIILCFVVLGGMGKVWGAILGAILLQGLDLIVLREVGDALKKAAGGDLSFVADPTNYRFFIFGMALVLVTRWLPGGLAPGGSR